MNNISNQHQYPGLFHHLTFFADNILVYFVNFGVDDVELLHPQHTRHCLWLDCAQVRVVYGELPAVLQSSEGVGDQLEEVEKVQLEMFHSLQPVEGVLTNDRVEIRSFLSDYTADSGGQHHQPVTGEITK